MAYDGQAFDLYTGEAKSLQFTEVQGRNLTGWTVNWRMATRPGAAPTLTKAAVITDGPGSKLTVTLLKADTNTLTPGTWYWDATRDDSGQEEVLATGVLTLRGRMTTTG